MKNFNYTYMYNISTEMTNHNKFLPSNQQISPPRTLNQTGADWVSVFKPISLNNASFDYIWLAWHQL